MKTYNIMIQDNSARIIIDFWHEGRIVKTAEIDDPNGIIEKTLQEMIGNGYT